MIVLDENRPRGIIWIASYPRSGNTWTRAFINALNGVMRDADTADVDINRIEEGGGVENAAALYPRFLGKPVALASEAEIAAARPRVQVALAESAGRPIYLKTHNANGVDFGNPLINPSATAGAIYIVRNPLDVAISYAAFSNTTIDKVIERMATPGWGIRRSVEKGHERVRVISGSWSENVASWTDRPNPAFLAVRYEDMIEKPEGTFARIARHILLKPTREQLRQAIALTDFNRLRAKESEQGFVEKPEAAASFFRSGRSGQWQDELTDEQVARIVKAHRPLMRKFGYMPDRKGSRSG
ncbi:MAG: sulfotransferase domain-containing protein [Bauldia sp.]|nr:sulfotransferase domain-containing protein [Bauldia sp.]